MKQFILHIVKSQTAYRIRKALSRDTLVPEEQNGPFHRIQHFFLAGEKFVQGASVGNFLAPSAADINSVPVGIFLRDAERTFSPAAPAAVAGIPIHFQHALFHFCHLHRAGGFHLAFSAAPALGIVKQRHSLADNAQIIQIRLHTVVGTAPHGNLKFMGQRHMMVSLVKTLVNLLA